ncbi:DUF4249 domain-containing protein [Pedobacter sp. L105]|uniref:DUF4249 domain-containing protein n=1 Tax=Pedobacter sp. L105 TaxID=1641871 RepID=UPI00131ACE57|nr:DUF4249 domain-containing protein [Pedobacter sp. L105]
MMKYLKIAAFCLLPAGILSCKKPYAPPAVTSTNSYLVVEGVINIGADSTIIQLSRTVNISAVVTKNQVAGAAITVESDQNDIYPLNEIRRGYYGVVGLNLNTAKKYHLRIKTADNQEYLSDFVSAQVTPPIDSIGSTATSAGLQLYTNTHDPNNNTHYYRWEYNETWQFHAKYMSNYVTNGTEIVPRSADQSVYSCFANDTSSTILLGSSAKLTQDVISQAPIVFIPSTAEKIETKYSILLRQYALSSDAYNFWVNLKKNTEQLGSIFDAQPSNINGNIRNISNSSEVVIGYISACLVQTKRIFISNSQLPVSWKTVYPYDCLVDTTYFTAPGTAGKSNPTGFNQVAAFLIPLGSTQIPIDPFKIITGQSAGTGYLSSGRECADCTTRGVKPQPAFWK